MKHTNIINILLTAFLMCISIVASGQNVGRGEADGFSVSQIPDSVFSRMNGVSYRAGCPVRRADLRYLKIRHVNAEGKPQHGELVCHHSIANDLLQIFRELYKAGYPIASVRLVDDFGADDERSMSNNNTSCFNFRRTSSGKVLSKHAYGRAIDINPLWNPCIHVAGAKKGKIEPANAKHQHIITTSDLCYKLFQRHGFRWGGAWRSLKDYQHFEK